MALVHYVLSLAVMLWLSGVVVDWTFTSGGVDVRAHLLVAHRCVHVFIHVLIFRGWSQSRNNFAVKFSQSTVHSKCMITGSSGHAFWWERTVLHSMEMVVWRWSGSLGKYLSQKRYLLRYAN